MATSSTKSPKSTPRARRASEVDCDATVSGLFDAMKSVSDASVLAEARKIYLAMSEMDRAEIEMIAAVVYAIGGTMISLVEAFDAIKNGRPPVYTKSKRAPARQTLVAAARAFVKAEDAERDAERAERARKTTAKKAKA